MLNDTSNLPPLAHPYYPVDAQIVGYLANDYSTSALLSLFACGVLAISALTVAFINLKQAHLSTSERATAIWFVNTGCIHLFFEGYFAWNHRRMGQSLDLFGQMWKEYAYSDSRYLTSNAFVLCMETVTAVCWGPLSLLVAWLIVTSNPLRHPFQMIVSLGQMYGDVLYYATYLFDLYHLDLNYGRPEAYYFWVYFVMINFIWMVIPGALLFSSVTASARAFRALDKMAGMLHGNGAAKKSL